MATIELDQGDNGGSRSAAIGDEVVLTLEETATSGYRWSLEEVDASVLEPGAGEYDPPDAGGLGAAGVRRFRFRVVGNGSGSIRLSLARSWDPGSSSATFTTTIVAGGAGG